MKPFSLSLSALLIAVVAVSAAEEKAVVDESEFKPIVDVSKADTWEDAVERETQDLKKLAESFVSVAEDEKRSVEERRKAINMLGKIGNKESIDFLIQNISLELPVRRYVLDIDRLKTKACSFALIFPPENQSWDVIPAILDILGEEKSKIELKEVERVLQAILGGKRAILLINHELQKKPESLRKANLEAIKRRLKHD